MGNQSSGGFQQKQHYNQMMSGPQKYQQKQGAMGFNQPMMQNQMGFGGGMGMMGAMQGQNMPFNMS